MFLKKYFQQCLLLAFAFFALGRVEAGTISGSLQLIPAASVINLSQEGALDWVHWGTFTEKGFDRKQGVEPSIGDPIGDPFDAMSVRFIYPVDDPGAGPF